MSDSLLDLLLWERPKGRDLWKFRSMGAFNETYDYLEGDMINNWETKKILWELEEPQLTPIQEGDTSMEEANVQKEMAMFQSVVATMVPKP